MPIRLSPAIAALAAAVVFGPAPARAEEPTRDVGSRRIELERTLAVPPELADEVWAYMRERYGATGPAVLAGFARAGAGAIGTGGVLPAFRTSFSTEQFDDEYFDTPDRRMLAIAGGIRYRRRRTPETPGQAKDGRELVQIKLSAIGRDPLERAELKFTPVPSLDPSGTRYRPLLERLDGGERRGFVRACQDVGVAAQDLVPVLRNYQTRRRLYVAIGDQPFATLSLDHVHAVQGWRQVRYDSIEVEISEITYTAAGPAARAAMEEVDRAITDDLVARFPGIVPDQPPKYTRSQALLKARGELALPIELAYGVAAAIGFALLYRRARPRAPR